MASYLAFDASALPVQTCLVWWAVAGFGEKQSAAAEEEAAGLAVVFHESRISLQLMKDFDTLHIAEKS